MHYNATLDNSCLESYSGNMDPSRSSRKDYEIQFKSSAWRVFKKLQGETRGRVTEAIWSLSEDPRPPGAVKLKGQRDLFRIRAGDYRVIYEIREQALVVLIIKVGHRRDIYQGL